jgi:hypothetical protein
MVTNSSFLVLDTQRSSDASNDNTNLSALPSINSNSNKKAFISKSALERAYPLGLSPNQSLMWFSTSTTNNKEESKDKDHKMSYSEKRDYYRERAGYYGGQARDGAKSFGGMMKKYGPVFFATYMGVYVSTVGGLYLGVESGALDPAQMLDWITGNQEETRSSAEVVAEILGKYRLTQDFAEICLEKPHVANLAIAWVATKFTEPLRLAFTAAIVPRIARHFKVGVNPDESEEDAAVEKDGEKPSGEDGKKENEEKK